MTAATITAPALRERLADIIDCTVQGAWPADNCAECRALAIGRCNGCQQQEADVAVLTAAIRDVQDAPTEAEALAAYMTCFTRLTGIPESEWSVGITAVDGEDVAAVRRGSERTGEMR